MGRVLRSNESSKKVVEMKVQVINIFILLYTATYRYCVWIDLGGADWYRLKIFLSEQELEFSLLLSRNFSSR